MRHPPVALRAFPPLSHCCAMRAGGRSPHCGAALAWLPAPGPVEKPPTATVFIAISARWTRANGQFHSNLETTP
ncbi:hypothetical protein CBY09_09335 [Acidovorax kalamii]|uniref:Uncharacterized protein n=1 Tax=Acidovorax kalamii TaxID=2004485 RepID=A0A235EML3_9BURK|nr:hypothetical protein CBY09_09335 [Acidovorax kalamii]